MLSLLLLFVACAEQPIVSCKDACAWVFGPCSDVNGAGYEYGQDGYDICVQECAEDPEAGDIYAECLSEYVGSGRFDTQQCVEPWDRQEDGSERPCDWFLPCGQDGCSAP